MSEEHEAIFEEMTKKIEQNEPHLNTVLSSNRDFQPGSMQTHRSYPQRDSGHRPRIQTGAYPFDTKSDTMPLLVSLRKSGQQCSTTSRIPPTDGADVSG